MNKVNLDKIKVYFNEIDYNSTIQSIVYIEKYLNSNYKYTKKLISIKKEIDKENSYFYLSKKVGLTDYGINRRYKDLDYDSIFEDLGIQLENSCSYDDAIDYINKIIIDKGLSNAEISNLSTIDSALLSKILNKKRQISKKDVFIKLCIGLGLNYNQSRDVLLRFGITIDSLSKRDKIIKYGLKNNNTVQEIDLFLTEFEEKSWL